MRTPIADLLLSFSRALLDQDIHHRLELERPFGIKRRTAVGVDGIHVHAEVDRKLHALQDQRVALSPIAFAASSAVRPLVLTAFTSTPSSIASFTLSRINASS